MAYHIGADAISLGGLQKRIETTDLVPSQVSLLHGLNIKLKTVSLPHENRQYQP